VPVIESGGKLRCRSVDVLTLLGLSLTEEPLPQNLTAAPVNTAPVNAAEPSPADGSAARLGFRKVRKPSTRTDPAPPSEPAPPAPHEQMQAIQQQLMQLAGDVEQLRTAWTASPSKDGQSRHQGNRD
jgi:hypothetical protein